MIKLEIDKVIERAKQGKVKKMFKRVYEKQGTYG